MAVDRGALAWRTRKITGGWARWRRRKTAGNRRAAGSSGQRATAWKSLVQESSGFFARFSFRDRLSQKILHLAVHAAQLVGGPFASSFHKSRGRSRNGLRSLPAIQFRCRACRCSPRARHFTSRRKARPAGCSPSRPRAPRPSSRRPSRISSFSAMSTMLTAPRTISRPRGDDGFGFAAGGAWPARPPARKRRCVRRASSTVTPASQALHSVCKPCAISSAPVAQGRFAVVLRPIVAVETGDVPNGRLALICTCFRSHRHRTPPSPRPRRAKQ